MTNNNFNLKIDQIISSFKSMKKNKADFNKTADLMLKTLKKNKIIFVAMEDLQQTRLTQLQSWLVDT